MSLRNELRQWEVVLVEFPFVDLVGRIVSNDGLNGVSNAVIALQMTSNLGSGFAEYNVLITDRDVARYPRTRPIKPSLVKPYVVFTLDKKFVRKRLGVLKEEKVAEVKEGLRRAFGL